MADLKDDTCWNVHGFNVTAENSTNWWQLAPKRQRHQSSSGDKIETAERSSVYPKVPSLSSASIKETIQVVICLDD
jgi:hypothetical protein